MADCHGVKGATCEVADCHGVKGATCEVADCCGVKAARWKEADGKVIAVNERNMISY